MARNTGDIEHVVLICTGKDCRKRGANALRQEARACLKDHGARRSSLVVKAKCVGMCKRAPVACVQPGNLWLTQATPRRLRQAIDESFA
jgi:NADH:ubiquinone oxidoreductase subunit E